MVGVFLQSWDKCLTSLHLKQVPLLINSVFLSTVIVLTSIAFGSGLGWKLNFLAPVLFFWAGSFPAGVVIQLRVWFHTCHPWCIFVSHLYQSAKFSGTFGRRIIFCCNPLGRVSLKQSMRADESVIPVFVKSNLKWAMCLSMFPVCSLNLSSFILAHASPVLSKGLNTSKRLVSNTTKGAKNERDSLFLAIDHCFSYKLFFPRCCFALS